MLLSVASAGPPPRLAVVAYDMACRRRAYRVRRVLESVHHARQYSVFEVLLRDAVLHGLLAELSAICDFDADRLAVWWPRPLLRLQWQAASLRAVEVIDGSPRAVAPAQEALRGSGNFIICYDVSDPDALTTVAALIAARGMMLQRSVYWLRLPSKALIHVLEHCAACLSAGDRLWAYPLAGAHTLWQIGTTRSALLPVASHRWN
jgi:CRISPR/Cas system-associated endoribonuclease Cas2